MMRCLLKVFGGIVGGLCLTGCSTTVPSLDPETNVEVSQVVLRVTCELGNAVKPYLEKEVSDKKRKYPWFERWTAQVDLNLVVNEQSGLSPSVSIIDLNKAAVLPGIGTFAQNFTLGLTGSLSSTAGRTETLSFAVSMKELKKAANRPECPKVDARGLHANLGLSKWVAAAFQPVEDGFLEEGHHRPPSAPRAASTPRVPGSPGGAGAALTDDAETRNYINNEKRLTKEDLKNLCEDALKKKIKCEDAFNDWKSVFNSEFDDLKTWISRVQGAGIGVGSQESPTEQQLKTARDYAIDLIKKIDQ
jgi:hypothetical protein